MSRTVGAQNRSPILYRDVIVQSDQQKGSFIEALDPKSSKTVCGPIGISWFQDHADARPERSWRKSI